MAAAPSELTDRPACRWRTARGWRPWLLDGLLVLACATAIAGARSDWFGTIAPQDATPAPVAAAPATWALRTAPRKRAAAGHGSAAPLATVGGSIVVPRPAPDFSTPVF